jgi:nucleoid DNA-binding protein
MGIKEIAALVVAQHADLTPQKVTSVLRIALESIRAELETTQEATVRLAPLGQFKVHAKEAKAETGESPSSAAEDKKKKGAGRRIVLKLAEAKVVAEKPARVKRVRSAEVDVKAKRAAKKAAKAGKSE